MIDAADQLALLGVRNSLGRPIEIRSGSQTDGLPVTEGVTSSSLDEEHWGAILLFAVCNLSRSVEDNTNDQMVIADRAIADSADAVFHSAY